MTQTLLDIRELCAGYRQPVVGPVSLTLKRGDILALNGANGCGKSTLLGAIAGHVKRFSGDIQRYGTISWLPQVNSTADELPLTGLEFLALANVTPKGLPEPLRGALTSRYDRLSGGQRQLLRVWATLHRNADILILDEPTNNLDPASETFLIGQLKSLANQRAILLVSHEQPFLERIANREIRLSSPGVAA
ncbi:MAG: ABC transporter [Gammaproteobacteria bacterium HGW-Gammaproteobacteria-14]|nr:MAG: ABC transporter [Gammaproteobacteria bacterium HGW-Gammaproteobacteria-14]